VSEDLPTLSKEDEQPRPGESFLARFHRRKTEARIGLPDAGLRPAEETQQDGADSAAEADPDPQPTDADMPPLSSLEADSDYSGFLSPKVSEALRRAALRKLFHGSAFNVIDELDDYAEDFTTFEALGDIITADMRHQIEVEAKKKAEALKQALLEEDTETPDQAAQSSEEKTDDLPIEDPAEHDQDEEPSNPAANN